MLQPNNLFISSQKQIVLSLALHEVKMEYLIQAKQLEEKLDIIRERKNIFYGNLLHCQKTTRGIAAKELKGAERSSSLAVIRSFIFNSDRSPKFGGPPLPFELPVALAQCISTVSLQGNGN